METPIRLLLVDDHDLFLEGLGSILEGEERIAVIGKKTSGGEALEFLANDLPDIMITDLNMPQMSGIELVKEVKQKYPQVLIIVLTMYNDRPIISEILMAEAEGYLLKNTDKNELLEAIYHVADGGTHYSNAVMSIILDIYKNEKKLQKHTTDSQLTERELEILRLISEEKSSKEIAEELIISRRTVETHRKNILKKTDAKSVVGLLKFSYKLGLISL